MSHEGAVAADGTSDIEERVASFLMRNFPQIAMHGGDAVVDAVDEDTGEVWIQLGGACSGCGISPMTVQAITQRLPVEIPEVRTVHVDAGGSGSGMSGMADSRARDDGSNYPDVPF